MMGEGNWRGVFAVAASPHSNCLLPCPTNFSPWTPTPAKQTCALTGNYNHYFCWCWCWCWWLWKWWQSCWCCCWWWLWRSCWCWCWQCDKVNCGLVVGVGLQALISPLSVSASERSGSNLNKEQNSFIADSRGRARVGWDEPSGDG